MDDAFRNKTSTNGFMPFNSKAAEDAADDMGIGKAEWVITEAGISIPILAVSNKQSFVAGARYQYLASCVQLQEKEQEIAELRQFKEDAIAMAAAIYLNRPSIRR